jgi:hypothetical protein
MRERVPVGADTLVMGRYARVMRGVGGAVVWRQPEALETFEQLLFLRQQREALGL